MQYLFRPPPLPVTQASTPAIAAASFQKFKNTLEQQIACRTPLLDDVLSTIESLVQSLHEDVEVIKDDEGDPRCVSLPSALGRNT